MTSHYFNSLFINVAANISEAIGWLESTLDVNLSAEEKWRLTAAARKTIRDPKKFNIDEYLNRFQLLRQPADHLLVN